MAVCEAAGRPGGDTRGRITLLVTYLGWPAATMMGTVEPERPEQALGEGAHGAGHPASGEVGQMGRYGARDRAWRCESVSCFIPFRLHLDGSGGISWAGAEAKGGPAGGPGTRQLVLWTNGSDSMGSDTGHLVLGEQARGPRSLEGRARTRYTTRIRCECPFRASQVSRLLCELSAWK